MIFKKVCAATLSMLCIAASLYGCGSAKNINSGVAADDYPVQIGTVTLNEPPKGVAVLSANLADIVTAMGYERTLKTRTGTCTQPELSVLPVAEASDAKTIKEKGATVVLADNTLSKENLSALKNQGLSVLQLPLAEDKKSLEKLYSQVGAAFKGGRTGYKHGQKSARSLFSTLDDIQNVIPDDGVPKTACYLLDLKGGVITGDTFGEQIFESGKFINVAKSAKDNKMSPEDLKRANPDYIFCPSSIKEQLKSTDIYKDLKAVKGGKVCVIEPQLVQWQGRSVLQAVTQMVGFVYPQLNQTSKDNKDAKSSDKNTSSEKTPTSSNSKYATLKNGDKGEKVLQLQKRLDELGYMFLACTGEYGDGTMQSIKDFQLLNDLTVTGVADEKTQQILFSKEAKPRK